MLQGRKSRAPGAASAPGPLALLWLSDGDDNAQSETISASNGRWVAAKFTFTQQHRIREFRINNSINGSAKYVWSIHEDDGGEPGTEVANSGVAESMEVNLQKEVDVTLPAGTYFWVFKNPDGTDSWAWSMNSNGADDSVESTDQGSSWQSLPNVPWLRLKGF